MAFNFPFLKAPAPEVFTKVVHTVQRTKAKPITARHYCTAPKGGNQGEHKNAAHQSGFTVKPNAPSSSDKAYGRSLVMYSVAALIAVGGLSYAAVPLYKMFCAATGYAGTTKVAGTSIPILIVLLNLLYEGRIANNPLESHGNAKRLEGSLKNCLRPPNPN